MACHITKNTVPVATVEQDGFIQILKPIDPRYQLPSHNCFAREVSKWTLKLERLVTHLAKVFNFVLTTDVVQ